MSIGEIKKLALRAILNRKESEFDMERAVDSLMKAYKNVALGCEANYDGYEIDESDLTVVSKGIEASFEKENLDYEHDRGRTLLHITIACAIRIGMNEGIKIGKGKGMTTLGTAILGLTMKEDTE
jgi:hypothetical protein